MAGYAKLWSGITESSLWGGSKEARLLFVTLLAKADSTGFVEAAPSGLARLANLTRQETDTALSELMAPDPESKSKTAEGRRVAIVPRGVCVINYEDYRKRRDDEDRREYMREYMRKYRAEGESKINPVNNSVNSSKLSKAPLAQAEAEAEAEAEIKSTPLPPKRGKSVSKNDFASGYSGEVINAVDQIKKFYPRSGDQPTSDGSHKKIPHTDWRLTAQRLDEIQKAGADLSICVKAAKTHVDEWLAGNSWIKAAQYFFGKEDPKWIAYYKAEMTDG